jgi:hypothetical protein
MAKTTKSKAVEEEERKEIPPLTPPPVAERGPAGRSKFSESVLDPMEPIVKETKTSTNILDMIMARLIKRQAFGDPVLALEITQGEFRGICFSFKTFELQPVQMENGMIPTRYETEIHELPERFGADWKQTEAFDRFTGEVLFAWLSYIQTNNLAPLLKAKPHGGVM